MMKRRRRALGISLLEVVVSVSIILVLAGIIFPVFSSARFRGGEGSDMAKMRQLGLAGSLYMDATDERQILDLAPLVKTNLVAPELLVSANDPHPSGYHHAYRKLAVTSVVIPGTREGGLAGYRASFATPKGTYGVHPHSYAKWLGEDSSAGWVVNMSRALKEGCSLCGNNEAGRECGSYHRLLNDGSVQFRRSGIVVFVSDTGETMRITHHLFTFTDKANSWIKSFYED